MDARKRELEDRYRIKMTHTMEEEMNGMCNLGEAIARRNLEAGIAQGIIKGRAEGGFEMLANLVRKHIISAKEAAEQLDMTETAFRLKAELPIQQ